MLSVIHYFPVHLHHSISNGKIAIAKPASTSKKQSESDTRQKTLTGENKKKLDILIFTSLMRISKPE